MKTSIRSANFPRRSRPKYPELQPGQVCLMNRPECGFNWEHPSAAIAAKRNRRGINEQFLFERVPHPAPTSKYTPHVGKKELSRK